jgi:hypothetical protein
MKVFPMGLLRGSNEGGIQSPAGLLLSERLSPCKFPDSRTGSVTSGLSVSPGDQRGDQRPLGSFVYEFHE